MTVARFTARTTDKDSVFAFRFRDGTIFRIGNGDTKKTNTSPLSFTIESEEVVVMCPYTTVLGLQIPLKRCISIEDIAEVLLYP
jgi:hypothetical protein